MDLLTLMQTAMAWFYLILTLEIIVTSSKSIIEKQLAFEGRLLFLAYAHMVYFGAFNIIGLNIIMKASFIDFLINKPIIMAYDWIHAFTVSFFGISFRDNPLFMFTYLVPIFFVYNFVEYWFRYGFSDKRISKLLAFAAVIMYISSNEAFGLIPALTNPFAILISGFVMGGGVFGIIGALVHLPGVIPFVNLFPFQKIIETLLVTALPVLAGFDPDFSSGMLGFLENMMAGSSAIVGVGLLTLAIIMGVKITNGFYKWLITKISEKSIEGNWVRIWGSWVAYLGLSVLAFQAGFIALNLMMSLLFGVNNLNFDVLVTGFYAKIVAPSVVFVLSFIAVALVAELLVFAAMFVLFNNMKYVWTGGKSKGGGAQSTTTTSTTETSEPTLEEDDGDRHVSDFE